MKIYVISSPRNLAASCYLLSRATSEFKIMGFLQGKKMLETIIQRLLLVTVEK